MAADVVGPDLPVPQLERDPRRAAYFKLFVETQGDGDRVAQPEPGGADGFFVGRAAEGHTDAEGMLRLEALHAHFFNVWADVLIEQADPTENQVATCQCRHLE